MNISEFNSLCQRYTIDPALAMENGNVVDCLYGMKHTKDDNAYRGYRNTLIMILETEY